MLTFLTLLLGIVSGPRAIALNAPPDTASIELFLDGEPAKYRSAPPWKFMVDFGSVPAPHHLDAIARNARGAEIGRARQRVNFPRLATEAALALLPGKGGTGRVARLVWESAVAAQPEKVTVTFDGKPLAAPNPERIELPPFVPERLHFLRAVADFPTGVSATAETTFGGRARDETEKELTAFPVRAPDGRLPALEAMDGWFLADGQPVHVEAVEESPGEIVVVKDERAGSWLAELEGRRWYLTPLRKGQRLRFCWPGILGPGDAAPGYDVFLRSSDYVAPQSVSKLLIGVWPPEFHGPTRLADAVAVAALSAAAGNRPRAVVLLVAGPDDESDMPVERVRGYLRALRVPLFVWAKNKKIASSWGKVDVLTNVGDLDGAASRLTKAVERQRIVWLEGGHLPQAISLSPKARKVTLVE